jgi:hypothetical protein
MPHTSSDDFKNIKVYYGDLHNHCDLSYGHGSLSAALHNARLQLDFASVTVHAVWPDLPVDDPRLGYLVDYHQQGFARAEANWAGYLEVMDAQNADGRFVTFPSFEWHSMAYGDYCVYYRDIADRPIIDAPDLPALRERLRHLPAPSFLIPHHIGYKRGYRGINWDAFTDQFSPVAEIFSFHGLSESSEGPYPYLHSMGPRHEQSTAQYGWAQGHVFGVVGSTDHHNAYPGSYGYGRLGVWATDLTRDALWEAIAQRRTYVLTGDRIALDFRLNGHFMGSMCPPSAERQIEVAVQAGSAIDYIDLLHNNQIIHRENVLGPQGDDHIFKVHVEMGWGEQAEPFNWNVDLQVEDGVLRDVEPRLRGYGPSEKPADDDFAYTEWQRRGDNQVGLRTRTRPNLSLHTASTEGLSLEIEGDAHTRIRATINGQQEIVRLGDLMTGARSFYTSGFVSPAICFHRAAPVSEYERRFTFSHQQASADRDWYTIRVRQRNGQWAWSSPIWVEGRGP